MTKRIRIEDIGSYAERKVDKLLRGVVLATNADVKLQSPVDTGRFAMSWQIGEGGPQPGALPPGEYAVDGEPDAVNYANGSERLGEGYSIHNNLPYAERLANGYSDQAPAGWIELIAKKRSMMVKKAWKNLIRKD